MRAPKAVSSHPAVFDQLRQGQPAAFDAGAGVDHQVRVNAQIVSGQQHGQPFLP
jgi:hypothetical protein